MVPDPADYIWSSHQAHTLGKQIALHSPHSEYLRLDRGDMARQQAYR